MRVLRGFLLGGSQAQSAQPAVRADDQLALSSRNGYLSDDQRQQSTLLVQTLKEFRQKLLAGHQDWQQLEEQAMQTLLSQGWKPDYVSLRQQHDLQPPTSRGLDIKQHQLVVLAAARLGNIRLIDNLEI